MQEAKEKNIKSCKISQQNHIIEQIGENGEMQYNCTACRKVFRSRSQKYYHINCNQSQNLIFKCEHCDKSFARRAQWKYHIESHLSPVNECDKCQKTFTNPLALKKHLTLHKEEPKVCPHCDKTFKKKISLEQHISAQHLNQLQYGCALCCKKYASKSSLQLHLQTHEKKRFECRFCGKLFQRNSILNLHIKKHYNTNAYTCTVCHKTFSESGALARHCKLHQESVLQYYCKICEKSILRKDNMTRHLTTIHPEESFEGIVRIIKPVSLQDSIEPDICDIYKTSQDDPKSGTSFLIIENKLLSEPFKINENIAEKSSVEDYSMINQIKVITAVPTGENEIIANNSRNILQEFANANLQQEKDTIFETQKSFYKSPNQMEAKLELFKAEIDAFEYKDVNGENVLLVSKNCEKSTNQPVDQIEKQNLLNFQHYFDTQKGDTSPQRPAENETSSEQVFPSVIKSVGNVKKDLTQNNLMTEKTINQTSIEYKHKKYCRNNYNIDLYRKILGCDEDDAYENNEKQHHYDHTMKSSTPVHWRKSFKNNYETSGS